VARDLADQVDDLAFAEPVTHVYNPLDYAWQPYARYVAEYGRSAPAVVLVGMNPGPFGMVQTGVPFGDVGWVRDWMGIEAPVDSPVAEHPDRPVQGFGCSRSEVSGQRLWGWAQRRFGPAPAFFQRFFVVNYCPLAFMEASGRNRTPDKLPKAEREALFTACDRALARAVALLRPRFLLGIGRFAEKRIRAACPDTGAQVGAVPHPSPASPKANQGWEAAMEAALDELGVNGALQR
jgi:single-strand selective monofunctional uracil DNA glycosylase